MNINNLSALVGSRICHDLISPIGAINNGLELLEMSRNLRGPEMDLIGESVSNASARIRFFRLSFGIAGDQLVGKSEVTSILRDLYGNSRLDIVWLTDQPQARTAVRLAFLGILCLEAAMPYGGRVEILQEDGLWALRGSADKLNADDQLWAHLTEEGSPAHELQPSQVQFGLLPALTRNERRYINVQHGESTITIRF